MPGKKLAPEKRKELEAEVAEKVKSNVAVAEIVKTLSEKYKVSGQTIRRYVSEAGHPGKKRKGRRAKKGAARGRRARQSTGSHLVMVEGKHAELVLRSGRKEQVIATITYNDEKKLRERLQSAFDIIGGQR